MKRESFILILALWVIFTHNLSAQDGCNVSIRPSTMPLCQMSDYPSGKPVETGETDCLKACKGNTVDYSATVQAGDACTWEVSGALLATVFNGGRSLRVEWGSGSGGLIRLTVVTAGGHVCTAEQCVELIESPTVQSISFPPYVPVDEVKVLTVCLGQEIRIEDHSAAGSSAITGSVWESDFGTVEGAVFTFTADHEGKIRHTVINECGCTATEYYKIVPREGIIPELNCYGTMCEGSSAKYHLTNPLPCHEYNWIVEGGDLLYQQGSPGILVQWGSPASGYGTLMLNSFGCEEPICPVEYRIPVITNGVPISGETAVCVGAQEIYKVPLWGSTEYTWSVNSPSGGSYIVHNSGMANEYWLEFTESGTYHISVNYDCDFLECQGRSQTLTVYVTPRLTISGDKESICAGESATFWAAGNSAPLTWRIYRQNQQIATQTGVTLTHVFTTAGNYRIEADGNLYCKASSAWLTVKAPPAPLTTITGPSFACPNSGIMLRSVCPPGYILEWESPYMVDSTLLSRGDISIHFGDSVGDVKVYRVDTRTGCRSVAYTHHVERYVMADAGLPASKAVCEGSSFTLTAPLQEKARYKWSISNNNLAHFTEGTFDYSHAATVKVNSHDIESITVMQFNVNLERTLCEVTDTTVVTIIDTVIPAPAFSLNRDHYCPGDTITAKIIDPMPNVTYWWDYVNTAVIAGDSATWIAEEGRIYPIRLSYRPLPNCKVRYKEAEVRPKPVPELFLTWGDYGNYFHITTDAKLGQLYQWKRNGILLSGQSESGLYDSIAGEYCCKATIPGGCTKTFCVTIPASAVSAPLLPVMEMRAASNPPVPLPLTVTVDCTTATISNSLGIPADSLTWTSDGMPGMAIGHTNTDTLSIWQFAHTGYCPISVSGTYNGIAYKGQTTVIIPVRAGGEFRRNCTMFSIIDASTYLHGHIPQPTTLRVIGENNTLYEIVGYNGYTPVLVVDLPQYSPSVVYEVSFINETCTLQTNRTYYRIPEIELSAVGGLCVHSPINLHYQVISGEILDPKWRTSNGVIEEDSILYSNSLTPIVQLKYGDWNGCTHIIPFNIELLPNRVEGDIVKPDYIPCLGDLYEINYQFNEPVAATVSYHWQPDTTVIGDIYPTYETGDYSITVFEENGCSAYADVNVIFNNRPIALIMGKTNYCRYDTVSLEAYSGHGYTCSWYVFDPQTQILTPCPDTATLAFVPTHAGTYKIILEVWLNSCSSSDTLLIKVFDNDFVPVIAYGANNCIHEPPVQLISVNNNMPLYWSNGVSGLSADFYTSGAASAYYLDPESGCKSRDALIVIWPQPNYDALLTGCFQKCPEFFPYDLGLYSLVPYSLRYWGWLYNGQCIAQDHDNTPVTLPLIDAGTYQLIAKYEAGCVTTSPELVIETTEACSCTDEMDLSYYIKNLTCLIEECRFVYTVDMFIYNNSNMPLYLNSLSLQYAQLLSCNGNGDFLPTVIPAHGYYIYTIRFTPDIVHAENFVFRFFSTQMDCYYDVPVSLNAEYAYQPCKIEECEGKLYDYKYMEEFRDELPFTYHYISLWVEPDMQIVDIWAEPGEILNYNYDPGNGIIGLVYLYNYNQLRQMADNGEEVCFYVLLCREDKMCKTKICIPAKYLLENVPFEFRSVAKPQEQPQQAGIAEDIKLRIVPNPATASFSIAGIAEQDIAELKLITLTGKEVKTAKGSANMPVGELAPATYIVRVITTKQEVHYLKLIKQ